MTEVNQVPLVELLAAVPADIRIGVDDGNDWKAGTTWHPVGLLCHDAAAELRRLQALCGEWENKAATWLASPEAARRLDGYLELAQRLNAAESVNAQLLEALESLVSNEDARSWGVFGVDNRSAFTKARDAIKAAKGEA
jgi:hypothetical protein